MTTTAEMSTTAAEVRDLFRKMGESSVSALEALHRRDPESAAIAIEERGALTRQIEALLPDLLKANAAPGSTVDDLLIGIRKAAEEVQAADRDLDAGLKDQRSAVAGELDALDDRIAAHSVYSTEVPSRKASINIVR